MFVECERETRERIEKLFVCLFFYLFIFHFEGFNVEEMVFGHLKMVIYDIGGSKLLWKHYYTFANVSFFGNTQKKNEIDCGNHRYQQHTDQILSKVLPDS